MVLIYFAHFMVVAAHVTPLDKPVGLFTQQLLRYQGLPDIA